MKNILQRIVVFVIFLFITTTAFAQNSNKDFTQVDAYVKQLGSLDTLNMGDISIIVTKHFPDKLEKVRAIFDWIAYNIDFDCKAARNDNNEKNSSDDVLKNRKATSVGYAALFQDMCSVASIRCLTVDGYIKKGTEDINTNPNEFNHTWDVVQLGQSQDEWHYVDPTWGSGYTDKDVKVYTKAFNDNYFFANKSTFNLQCFPDNMAWQLDNGPKNKKEFFASPIVKDAAYLYNITSYIPVEGYSKVKQGKLVKFSIGVQNSDSIKIVSVKIGSENKGLAKQVNYTLLNGTINFNYTFNDTDTYPFAIFINGKEVLDYLIEVDN
jgi:transglutaminase/protease-like cytokinesis protein 3